METASPLVIEERTECKAKLQSSTQVISRLLRLDHLQVACLHLLEIRLMLQNMQITRIKNHFMYLNHHFSCIYVTLHAVNR